MDWLDFPWDFPDIDINIDIDIDIDINWHN